MKNDEQYDSGMSKLVLGFLKGDARARATFPKTAQRYLETMAREMAADLPFDLREEVVQQTFLNLLAADPDDYDPARGSPIKFLRLIMKNAIRQVRASYTPAGKVTRVRKRQPTPAAASLIWAEAAPPSCPAEEYPDPSATTVAVEAKIDAHKILGRLPANTAKAIWLAYAAEETSSAIEAKTGINRFKFHRIVDALQKELRAA
jgi:DNA-directed RNA polymerase specialized sigma24 family protein